jgi:hypothetical protein
MRDKADDLITVLKGEEATKERHGYFKNEKKRINVLVKIKVSLKYI